MTDVLDRLRKALADRYTIERQLGRGAMATVYLAADLKHRRHVAIKVLDPELARALGSERFLREVEVTAKLTHPHILTLIDSGEVDGFLYYVMPYIEGETLRQRMTREGQLPLEDALQITREVAGALGYAHSQGLIHRDIKPENVLLSAGEAVVADFGIARAITEAGGEHITETDISIGTPAYMSPEQASAEPKLDGRSDIYSLGCVLYEMLAGEPPFTGTTAQAIVAKKLSEATPRVSVVRETVPAGVEAAIDRALAKAPADRYRTAGELRQALSAQWARLSASKHGDTGAMSGPAAVPRIVVLPFENLGAAEDEYFADGITDEITSRLARLSRLSVIARSSAMRYKGTDRTITQIGEELGVAYVLSGTVRWDKSSPAASRVRVSPELVRVADGADVWAEPYQATLAGIFEIQSAVADRVAEAMDVALLEPERQALAVKPTESLEAYDLYLLGRHHLRTRTAEGLERAIDCFNGAIARDSEFAAAYAGLAETYAGLPSFTEARTSDVLPQARAAALQALALDDTLAEAHTAVGFVAYVFEWDWAAAETRLRDAIRLNPSYATARLYYTYLLITLGRLREARDELASAQYYAPLSDPFDVGFAFRLLREPERAVAKLEQSLELDPGSVATSFQLGVTYHHDLSRANDARTAWQMLTQIPHVGFGPVWESVLAHLGDPVEAIAALDRWIEAAGRESVHWYVVATLYAIFGAHDRAVEWMERGYEERSTLLAFVSADPVFDALRSHPGFSDIVRRIGVPG